MSVMKTLSRCRYPTVGERVRAVGSWRGKSYDVTGIVLGSRTNPRSPAWATAYGAIFGTILTDDGRKVDVPWSTNYIAFTPITRE